MYLCLLWNGTFVYRFPCDPKRKATWIKATKKTDWNPAEQSCLCSLHFKDDSFNENNQLFDNAIPTIFFDDFHVYIKNVSLSIILFRNVLKLLVLFLVK